jgi:hypothetical protein
MLNGFARRIARRMIARAKTPRDFWTPYLSWLTFANAGMLARGNVWCMNHAISNLPSDDPVLEIGAFCGLSTNVLGYLLERNGRRNRLITCDKWEFEGSEDGGPLHDSGITHEQYREFVMGTFERNVRMFSPRLPAAVEMLSDEMFAAWATGDLRRDVFGRDVQLGGPISFAYIDGNHTYEFAKRDFQNCDRYLVPGGFILFDDSEDGADFGANRVARESLRAGYTLVAKNRNYLVRKRQ